MLNKFLMTLITFGLLMNMLDAEETHNLSHDQRNGSFEAAKQNLIDKIQTRGNLPHVSVEKQLDLLEQLSQFELGQFLIERAGLNGYWTHYTVSHPSTGRLTGLNQHHVPFHPLEELLLNRAPTSLATQERFAIFKTQISQHLHEGCSLASIPCGVMSDLLDLDFSTLTDFSLHGIDLDPEALSQALDYAKERKLDYHCSFSKQDAWDLGDATQFDLIASNGLNIYEPDEEKVIDLYRQFYKCLKPQGILVTSFLTPPPIPGLKTEWKLESVNPQDAMMQKIIFNDILSPKWQIFRSEDSVKSHLEQAGFCEIEIFYDTAHIFPTVVAKKK
jgi:SAM-dependent methyltransferase